MIEARRQVADAARWLGRPLAQLVIVDTSFGSTTSAADNALIALLETSLSLAHPFVIGELARGNLRQQAEILDRLRDLPAATVAQCDEVLEMIERDALWGRGIGWVDAHLAGGTTL